MLPARQDCTNHHRLRNARKIVLDNWRGQRDEEPSRRLRVYYERFVEGFRVAPVGQFADERVIAVRPTRRCAGTPGIESSGKYRQSRRIDADGDIAAVRDVRRVTEQAEPGYVSGALHAERDGLAGRIAIECPHRVNSGHGDVGADGSALERRGDEARSQRLGQHERVPGTRAGVGQHVVRVHLSGDGESVLQLLVNDRVPTDDGRACFMNLVLSSTKYLGEDLDGERVDGEADNAEGGQRLPTHGVDVGERVRGGDLPELIRIVDDGREKVDGLHQREIIGQPEHPRVIEGLATDEDSGIGSRDQRRERAVQVTRT